MLRIMLVATAAVTLAAAASAAELAIEEVIVTAEKREANIQDVGIAVSALDQAAVERLNARDLRDLQAIIPNMTINEVGIGPSMSQVSIRGVNSQDPEKSFDPAVGTFIDGIYLGSSAYNLLDTFDLERIEVLRGPQGTLFGRNTTGGAVNAVRSRPTGELGLRASFTGGEHGREDLKAVFNTGITDSLALKLAGFRLKDDGFWNNDTPGGPDGARDRWNASASLLWTLADRGELQLTYDRAEDDSDLPPYLANAVNTPSPIPVIVTETNPPVAPATIIAAFPPDIWCGVVGLSECNQSEGTPAGPHFQNSELDAWTLNGEFALSDNYNLAVVLGTREHEEAVYIDFDGTARTVFDVARFQEYEQESAELRLSSELDGPFNFILGAFYFESEYQLRQAIKLDLADVGAPVPPGLLYVNGAGDEDDHEATTYALFGQADIDLADSLTLTLGLRANWDEREIFTAFFDPGLPPPAPYAVTDGIPAGRPLTESGGNDDDWFELTPKIALNWSVSEDVLLYGSWTRGYNSGGFSARAGTVADVTTAFDPEIIDAYEIGVKSDLLDGRLRLNAAIFMNLYDDKQEEAIQPAPPPTFTSTTVRNVAEAQIQGVEIEASALVTEFFRLDANLGLLNARYEEWDGFLGDGQFVSTPAQPPGTLIAADFSSLDLRRAPDVTASIVPQFFRTLGNGEIEGNMIFRYTDEMYTEILNNPRGRIPAQWLIDASLSYSFGGPERDRYMIKVFGRNITDEDEIASFTNSIVDFSTLQIPRRWGVELLVNL